MSISIKNITLAIDGTQSNMFKMEIDGGKYRLDNFTLVQTLMKPNTLKFIMYKDPEEDVNEPQFSICKTIIGKPISLTLQTDPMEQEIPSFSDEGKTADIEFEGIIMSASGSRRESQYIISVEAHTWEALLIDNPNCKSYEDSTLEDIVNDVINPCGQLQPKVNPHYQDIIPYTVQYNENNYQFISRLAKRYGEWFYNDGKQLVFGNMPESEPVQLAYPSKDIPSYSIRMKMLHVPFRHVASSYQEHNSSSKEGKEEMEKEYNELNTSVYNASMENYQKETWQNLHSGGYADEDSREKILNVSSKTQARGEKASMLIYEGQTYSSRLKLGGKLVIKDNYISDSSSNDKSDVDLDEIIITSLTHHFTSDERYSNMFEGIPSACDYPPYLDPEAYPKATPCRAIVYDTEDPMHLGRIRVQFWWQYQRYIDNAPDKEQLYSPWLRIAYPYAGPNKGYNFIPECEEEVMIDFEGGNAERPYVNGALFDGILKPDEKWYPGDNEVKAIRTRNDHTIEIHDKGKGGYIKIYDNKKNNYVLTFSTDGDTKIKIDSSQDIEINAARDIKVNAGRDIVMKAKREINGHSEDTIVFNSDIYTLVASEGATGVHGHNYLNLESHVNSNGASSTVTSWNDTHTNPTGVHIKTPDLATVSARESKTAFTESFKTGSKLAGLALEIDAENAIYATCLGVKVNASMAVLIDASSVSISGDPVIIK